MVGVAMEYDVHWIPGQWLLETAGPEVWVNLEGLSDDCTDDRRVVQ
jgi:hypothetical protein